MPVLGIIASQMSGHLWAPSGAYDSIATVNVGTAVSSITFSSIPSTYTHLQLRFMASAGYGSFNNTTIRCELNGDTTDANYYNHYLFGNGDSALAGSSAYPRVAYGLDSPVVTSTYGVGIIDLLDYSVTTKNKTLRTLAGFNANQSASASEKAGIFSMLWNNTAAINSIKLVGLDGNWTVGSQFALYGIRGGN
jgi:hypothetical protein